MEVLQQTQQELSSLSQAGFIALLWGAGCLSGMSVAALENRGRIDFNVVTRGVLSGFFSVAIVGIYLYHFGGFSNQYIYPFCLAIGIGLTGKRQVQLLDFVLDSTIGKIISITFKKNNDL